MRLPMRINQNDFGLYNISPTTTIGIAIIIAVLSNVNTAPTNIRIIPMIVMLLSVIVFLLSFCFYLPSYEDPFRKEG